MSFGFGVGDFIAAIELVSKIRKAFANAPHQFRAISDDVSTLSIVLQDVDVAYSKREFNDEQERVLKDIDIGCQNILDELQQLLDKNTELGSERRSAGKRIKRVWRKLQWDPDGINQLRGRINTTVGFLNAFNGQLTRDNVAKLVRHQDDQEHQTIVDWITLVDYTPQQNDYIARRQEGTGQWFLDSAEFQEWLKIKQRTLFCSGIPGAGKTILTSVVIENLYERFRSDPDVGISYIYFNYQQQDKQIVDDLLASLLRQLTQGRSSLADPIRFLYERHKDRRTRPSRKEILRTLQSIAVMYPRVFIVIDALDEFEAPDNCRSQFLKAIFDLQENSGANIFATSRSIPEIRAKFNNSTSIEIRASNEDIRNYLVTRTTQSDSNLVRDHCEEIKTSIIEAVDGMFLLAKFYFDSIVMETTLKRLKKRLDSLATGSGAYSHAYEVAMKRIESQTTHSKELAKQALSWIICAKKPLTRSELQHAIAVEADEPQFDEDNLCQVEDMVSACAGLVTVDEESDIIRLAHRTVQEYFERTHRYWFPDAHVDIARTCISYLLFDVFESGPCQTDSEFEERLESNQLYGYAAQNWGHHARQSPKSLISNHIMDFLQDDSKVEASVQALVATKRHPSYSNYSQEFPRSMAGSHLAAFFGLEGPIEDFTRRGNNLNLKDSYYRTPLSWAAKNGHDVVIAFLAAQGVDINTKDKSCETPLSLAAGYGHKAVVQLLLNQQGVDLESKDIMGRTPLSRAAMFGHAAVVEILLARDDIKPDSEDNEGRTPLLLAAMFGHGDIVKLLLDTGNVDPEAEDNSYGRTPLSWAAEKGYVDIIEGLLSTDGVNPDSKSRGFGIKGRTPLSYAAGGGHQTVIELLVQTGDVDPDSKDDSGRTPLSYAVPRVEIGPSKYLLEQGASPMIIDIHRKSILHHAVSGPDCNLETIKMLLALGAPKYSVDDDNMTPLHYTSVYGGPDIAKLIIQNEVPVDIAIQRRTRQQNKHEGGKILRPVDCRETQGTIAGGLTPLHYAALVGNARMVQFFLDHGSNPNAKSQYGETPLHLTLRRTVLAHRNFLDHGGTDAQPQDGENLLHLIPWPVHRDSWEDDHNRLEYVLTLTDPEGDDADEIFENVTKERICVLDALLHHPRIDVNIQDIKGASALHCPKYEYEKCDILISKLIERGADLSLKNLEERTPLHLACRGNYYSSVEVLLSHGADISHTDSDGLNSLHCAAHSTNVETISRILEVADTSYSDVAASVDNSGRNALHHLLVNLPNIEGVRLLVRKGVDVNGQDIDGNTPLAAYLSNPWVVHEQICRLLLSSGSDVLAINHQGLALPHIFSSWLDPNIEVLKTMMDFGIDLAARDRDGRTLLHHSAFNGSITEPILSFLLDNTSLCYEDRDSLGRTPREYAVEEAGKKRHKFSYERKRWSRSLGILRGHEEST